MSSTSDFVTEWDSAKRPTFEEFIERGNAAADKIDLLPTGVELELAYKNSPEVCLRLLSLFEEVVSIGQNLADLYPRNKK